MEIVLVVVALVAGASLPVQAGVNATLARFTGRPEWAVVVSFGCGFATILLYALVARLPAPGWATIARAPAWAWTGGALGAIYVTAVIVLTPRIGVAATLVLVVAGQMVGALLMDHFGLLGVATRPITGSRVGAAGLLVAAVLLMRR